MENYYFLEGDHRRGPFALDQLKTYPISEDTPIWKDSRNEWLPAEEVEELRGFVMAEVGRNPVGSVKAAWYHSRGDQLRRKLIWVSVAVLVVAAVGFILRSFWVTMIAV